jgi:TatD DNase family protein
MNWIDIGVNFHSKQLAGKTGELIERACAAGVVQIMATGTSLASSLQALELACGYAGQVSATAGVHPHDAQHWPGRAVFEPLWSDSAVVAIGECGLDYNRMFSPAHDQRRAFEDQLQAAVDHGKPLFLHCRDAFDDFHAMLRTAHAAGATGVVHCFTEGRDEALEILDLGFDLGITGWVTDAARGQALRDAIPGLPLDRIHLETDAPYLSPRNAGKRRPYNEPANVAWVGHAVAQLLGLPVEDVAAACTANSRRLFRLTAAPPVSARR